MLEPRHILDVKKHQIKQGVLHLFGQVEVAIKQAIACLDSRDQEICQRIILDDSHINAKRRLLEQDCMVAIASQQPVAHDLREIIAAMRMVSELERMGDYAGDIAASVLAMDGAGFPSGSAEVVMEMSVICLRMLALVAEAYDQANTELASRLTEQDDMLDGRLKRLIPDLMRQMQISADMVENGLRMLWIAHNLERCGDRLTNIAEQVVFMVENEIVDLG